MPIELMDQSQKESLSDESSEIKKCCFDCKTTKTPLWRVGPAGPKSLCNACGIRYRKKRSALLVGLNKGPEKKKEKPTTTATSAAASTTTKNSGGGGGKDGKLREGLRVKLMALGEEVLLLKRQRSPMKRQRSHRKLGEEERAAILLMSLSCGSVFA